MIPAAPRAAPVTAVVPRAAPVPAIAPRVAPGPPVVPCAAPGSPAVPRAAPVPPPAPARYAQPVQVYRRRSTPTPAPPPAPEALATPTLEPSPPPPPPTRSRVELAVYHPQVIHRDPRHVHPMETRRMASQAATLSATEGEPRVSPVPSSIRDALADPHWRRAMEEGVRGSFCQSNVGPRAASVWLQCGHRQVDLDAASG